MEKAKQIYIFECGRIVELPKRNLSQRAVGCSKMVLLMFLKILRVTKEVKCYTQKHLTGPGPEDPKGCLPGQETMLDPD